MQLLKTQLVYNWFFDTLDFNNETILIKGARTFQFEEIVYLLEEKHTKQC
jgi:hypothetical protein